MNDRAYFMVKLEASLREVGFKEPQLTDFLSRLNALSEYEFWQIIAEARETDPLTPAEFLKLEKDLLKHDVEPAAFGENVTLLDWTTTKQILGKVGESNPSDLIELTWRADDKLCSFWRKESDQQDTVPADLFFANTIPLMDCEITVDEREKQSDGLLMRYRVVIFENYKELINATQEGYTAKVGMVLMHFKGHDQILPICVTRGLDNMVCLLEVGISTPIALKRAIRTIPEIRGKTIANMMFSLMSTWYGIQIALLHPTIKEVFSHPENKLVYSGKQLKQGRRVTRYIRKHVIREEEIDAAIVPKHDRQRNTLVWYVIGHWRHYKNGSLVFIQGHWKGPLRQLKKNLDETREREIILTEDN